MENNAFELFLVRNKSYKLMESLFSYYIELTEWQNDYFSLGMTHPM